MWNTINNPQISLMMPLLIEPFTDQYLKQVQSLIVAIQTTEFDIDIDLSKQPDLQIISDFYQHGLGNFWVAIYNKEVVGTISLLDIGNKQTALRKMFVKKDFRGQTFKTGQLLLDTAIAHAQQTSIDEIYLGTTEKFLAAQRFYEKNNFVPIQKNELPIAFPVMGVDSKFYVLRLNSDFAVEFAMKS